eukprot:CAMPEP_0172451068 /NCGR_PEP_ID=MMETSP1065-20121228/9226_1 /TAXON_ID=265537 /ORGANISM="Amphiprora paludosa, Strain CCMP125" /LENGTH=282 /DNA_ID=CAMNT_0013202963 /DNA_START=36 /DNA_END=884 /DNA_ORIENTATION=+
MTLIELLRRGAASQNHHPKSCLKKKSRHHPKSLHTHLGSQKTVTFATNSFNDRVWSMVKSIDMIPPAEASVHAHLWWTEDEIAEIRGGLWDLVAWASPDYSVKLQETYESAGVPSTYSFQPVALSEKSRGHRGVRENDDDNMVPDSFSLCLDTVTKYSRARGLEAVINPVLDDFKLAHRQAVLHTQNLLKRQREPRRTRRSKSMTPSPPPTYSDLEWDLLREKSLERSRPCRYMATTLAEFDRQQAIAAANAINKSANRSKRDSTPKAPNRRSNSKRNLVAL